MNRFWNWAKNEETGERTLYLCGVIAQESWYADDVTPAAFKAELFSGEGDIVIWINSPGGDCLAASQIYNMLMDYKGNVTVKIDSIAASAASVIAMAGTKVLISPTGLMLIHDPASVAIGDTEEMRKAIQMLDEVKESILNAYEIRTGLSRARLSHLMSAETWMNANMAIELGFADDLLFRESKASRPLEKQFADNDGYTYSLKAVSNNLLAKIMAQAKRVAPVAIAPMVRADTEETEPAPTPPAPTEEEVDATPAQAEQNPTPAAAEKEQPAGVSVSALEKRLDLLRPYGITPINHSNQTN